MPPLAIAQKDLFVPAIAVAVDPNVRILAGDVLVPEPFVLNIPPQQDTIPIDIVQLAVELAKTAVARDES
jgi:hypothetical protein